MEEEQIGEGGLPIILGEGGAYTPKDIVGKFIVEERIVEKKLTFEEASQCLNTLGKDESGVRYAYLMITAIDRKLTDVSTILNFKHVLFLDLSGNYLNLEAVQVLAGMPFLLYIKLDRNRLDSAALDPMYYLQCLILNRNRITETCDINQEMLEMLELQDNLIYTIQFDSERLKNLKFLNLRGNQLIDLSGTFPSSLEKLYLNQNKISKIVVDFSQLPNLTILHLRDNQIRKLNCFTNDLANLTYLNLRNNKISKLREFIKLQCLPKLDTLIVMENPVSAAQHLPIHGESDAELDEEDEIFGEDQLVSRDTSRVPLLVLLPNLKRINKDPVTYEEQEEAELRRSKILEQIFEELSSEEETEPPTTTDYTTDYTTETEMGAFNTRGSVTPIDDEEDTTVGKDASAVDNVDESLKAESSPPLESNTEDDVTQDIMPPDNTPLEDIKEENEPEL